MVLIVSMLCFYRQYHIAQGCSDSGVELHRAEWTELDCTAENVASSCPLLKLCVS